MNKGHYIVIKFNLVYMYYSEKCLAHYLHYGYIIMDVDHT